MIQNTILNHLIEKANGYAHAHNIKLVDFGITKNMIYAIVDGDNRKCIGVTLTPLSESQYDSIKGTTIEDVFNYAKEYNPMQRAFALALINALGQHAMDKSLISQEDIRTLLSKSILNMTKEGDEVIFIGNLKPVVMKLKEQKRKPIVFCRNKEHYADGIYSDIFEYEKIQTKNIAIITGASLIGSTIDALIKLSPDNSPRILAGFSASAHPSWFIGTGITHIASMSVDIEFKKFLQKDLWDNVFDYPAYFVEVK